MVLGTISGRPMPELAGAVHSWVRVRGIRLHIAEFGQGAPLVLLHGFPQHWYAWRKVIAQLRGDYRVICVDLRGFGWSEESKRGYDIDNLADDVLALLDALGLVGHDWGAQVGFRLCLRAPERVTSFLALNMVHPWPLQRHLIPNLWRMWFTAVLEYPVVGAWVIRHWPAFTRFLLRHEVADPRSWKQADLDEFVEASQVSARAGQGIWWQFVLRDIPALLLGSRRRQRLTVPTVLMGGAKDPTVPPSFLAGGEKHADRLEVRIVPDAGHYLPEERPDVVAAAITDLFRESPRARHGRSGSPTASE